MNEETKMILEKLDLIGRDVSELKQDVSGLKQDVSGLKQDVSGLKQDVSGLKQDVSELKQDVSVLKQDISDLKERMTNVEEEQKKLRFILENETNKKIDIIGDGHVDLVRRLDEARELQRDKEEMKLQILNLNIDMRKVKEAIGLA